MDPITIAMALLSSSGLGDWVGSKLQGLLGESTAKKVINVAQVVTGIANPQEVLQQVQANAELASQLRLKLIDNEQELVRLDYSDRSNARSMQVAALQQSDEFSKRFIYYLATAWSLAAMIYIAFITFAPIPTANIRFADTILGFMLGTVIATILQFFYGSAQSNRAKDSSIANLIDAVKGK